MTLASLRCMVTYFRRNEIGKAKYITPSVGSSIKRSITFNIIYNVHTRLIELWKDQRSRRISHNPATNTVFSNSLKCPEVFFMLSLSRFESKLCLYVRPQKHVVLLSHWLFARPRDAVVLKKFHNEHEHFLFGKSATCQRDMITLAVRVVLI